MTEERSGLHLREKPTQTLADVRKALNVKTETISVNGRDEIVVDLTKKHEIRFPKSKVSVPATEAGILALGNSVQIPSQFLQRIDTDLQEHILTTLIQRTPEYNVMVLLSDEGINDVREPQDKMIDPRRLVDIIVKTIDVKAPVVAFWRNLAEFRLDTIVPEGFDRGIGGDKKVGDITRGGLRTGIDLKHNLAPWIKPYTYRLACTNGMEYQDVGLKIEARGNTVEDVLAEYEAAADRAFSQVEGCIKGLYDLRSQKIDNPERTLARILRENRMPARTIADLVEIVPEITDNNGHATMFDLVNLVTNAPNDPTLPNRDGSRRKLEAVGGSIVNEHVARCRHCQSRLN